MVRSRVVVGAFAVLASAFVFAQPAKVGGAFPRLDLQIRDSSGQGIPRARLWVMTVSGAPLASLAADETGKCQLAALPAGDYVLRVEAEAFAPRTLHLASPYRGQALEIPLEIAPLALGVTVTAERSLVTDVRTAPQMVEARGRDGFLQLPLRTVGQALEHAGGVLVQETTAGQSSPFLRGLTGYQTLLVVDDIRLNTSIFRSGPNQYLGFVEPGQVETVEAVLGPAASTYGSDSLGGTIQLRTVTPRPGPAGAKWFRGEGGLFGASGDLSGRADLTVSGGWTRGWLLANAGWHRHNDMRAGGAGDTHNVYLRYFGIEPSGRLQDTAYRQYGTLLKGGWRTETGHDFSASYARGSMGNVRAYRELTGGLGRLQALYEPQTLDLLYGRWEKLGLGWLDSLRGTVSMNRQQDDSLRQGPLFSDVVSDDRNGVRALGVSSQGTASPAVNTWLAFGADYYAEEVRSYRSECNPLTGVCAQKRPQYPDGSRYRTTGLYAQSRWQSGSGRLQLGLDGRWTDVHVGLGTASGGQVPNQWQTFRDLTWNANLRWRATSALSFGALAGRGFRAPNLNDLGSLGLTGLGFEVPAAEAVAAGAVFGADASEGALPSARSVRPLQPESMLNYEASVRLSFSRFTWRAQGFTFELYDPIVRRTMLFPAAAPPSSVAGVAVTPLAPTAAQRAAGVVTVASPFDARAIKAFVNDGVSRYAGAETDLRWSVTRSLSIEASYSWISGKELNPDRPARRLPPQQAFVSLRYQASGRRPWMEASAFANGAQTRLNPGDVDDERIGASRRRSDIASFFRYGINSGSVTAGADGKPGNTDDVFMPTGETLRQIQDRVLPLGSLVSGVVVINDQTRVPLYSETPAWWTLRFRTGMPLGERWDLFCGVDNLLDRRYRVHGSGIDGSGISAFAGVRFRF